MTTKLHRGLLLVPALLVLQACNSKLQPLEGQSESSLNAMGVSTEKATAACSATKIKEILETASTSKYDVKIGCNVTLKPGDVVSKVVDFMGPNASGVTFDCNGAVIDGHLAKQIRIDKKLPAMDMIKVRPVKGTDGVWQPPQNITIKNCEIRGAARIYWGDRRNSTGDEILASSRKADHTAYLQSLAPRNIHFVNVNFNAKDFGNMLYFGPGVTYSSVVDSKFTGHTTAGAIYFEAESAHNLVKNNVFETGSDRRELISVDASANNTIINNKFLNLKMGGIFLYRNCGENKVIRHTAPDNNIIVNNVFDYTKAKGEKYGIYVSSRSGGSSYCGDDDGYIYGSSADNLSPARNNIIIQNRFIGQTPAESIKIAWSPNVERDNVKVTSAPARKAGCYVKDGSPKDFIDHGESVSLFLVKGVKTCLGKKITCNDGITSQSTVSCTSVQTKNVCYLEKNTANRLVVRAEDGTGLAYFDPSEVSKAEAKLKALVDNKTCDSSSRSKPIVVALTPTPTPSPTPKATPTPKPTPSPTPAPKKVCSIELNSANRLVVRDQNGTGLAYFDPSQGTQAQAKLRELINNKTCDASSKTTLPSLPAPPECVIELNSANRLVVRVKSTGEGLAYFSSNQKKEAEAKLKDLQKAKTCR